MFGCKKYLAHGAMFVGVEERLRGDPDIIGLSSFSRPNMLCKVLFSEGTASLSVLSLLATSRSSL